MGEKAGPPAAKGAGMGFPMVKERMARALAAIGLKQHALCAIEHLTKGVSGVLKWGSEFRSMVFHRRTSRCTYKRLTIPSANDDCVVAIPIFSDVVALRLHVAIIEVGEIPKYHDAEPGHGIQ